MSGAAQLPSQLKQPRTYRTRPNPFADDWPWIAGAARATIRRCKATTLFALLCDRHPGRYQAGQLRTLQRHIAAWRAQHGPDQEVMFPQVHRAGRGRAVRLHAHDRPGRHAGRRAVPAPGLPPGADATRMSRRSRSASRRASRRWSKGSRRCLWQLGGVPAAAPHRSSRARRSTRSTPTGGRRRRSATRR